MSYITPTNNRGKEILFLPNIFSEWVQLFFSQGIARSAVPIFFLFSAYLQAKKNDSYAILLKKRAKSLFLPFVLWTTIYVFYFSGLKLIIAKFAPNLLGHPENTALSWIVLDWFHKILGYSFEKTDSLPEVAYHFWFIRDLMVLILISPVLKFLIRKFPVLFFAIVSVIYFYPIRIYFVEAQALFFYVAGLYWAIFDIPLFEKIDEIPWIESILLFLIAFFITHIFYEYNSTFGHFMVSFACIISLKISGKIITNERLFSILKYLAEFSFFLFAVHTPLLNAWIRKAWIFFFPMKNAFFCLFEYFGASILTILIGTVIGIFCKKICPVLFKLLNGDR